LSIARRIAGLATMLVALGIFTGTARADTTLTVTPTINGAGTVVDSANSAYVCTASPQLNTDAHACGAIAGHPCSPIPSKFCLILKRKASVFLNASAESGWKFVGWKRGTVPTGCTTDPSCGFILSTTDLVSQDWQPVAMFHEDVTSAFTAGGTPPAITSSTSATFRYTTNIGTKFLCKLDGVSMDCGTIGVDHSATSTLINLEPNVSHTFSATAQSVSGNNSDNPATFTWKVDTLPPTASLDPTSGPGQGALQTITSETFRFQSNEPGSTFKCSLDSAAFSACTTPLQLSNLSAGAHRFRVQATDRAGNVSDPVQRDWTVAIPDADSDGFNATVDCNDSDPSTHPGATDIPDNGKDENCDGVDAHSPPPPPPPAQPAQTVISGAPPASPEQIQVVLAFGFKATKHATKLTKLQVKNIPFGATIKASCRGGNCPKRLKGKGFTKKKAFGTVDLKRFITKPLKPGTALTVTVSKPGAINAIKVLKIRASKAPVVTTRCQPPGAKKPVSC
jgi:hypothetical protein